MDIGHFLRSVWFQVQSVIQERKEEVVEEERVGRKGEGEGGREKVEKDERALRMQRRDVSSLNHTAL